jgi:flagella basal body P-ring formation protein FlgA
MKTALRTTLLLLALLIGAAGARADTVTLRSFVRVAPGAALTLGDVAELSGPDAQALASIIVMAAGDMDTSLDMTRIRELLKAHPGLNMGRLELSGSVCRVRQSAPAPVPTQAPAPPRAPEPVGETVKDRVAARIAMALNADPGDLRLEFEDQADLLRTPVAGRTVAIQPTGQSDKMSMSIRVYQGDTIVAQGVARVGVQVRRDVLVARTNLARGMQTKAEMLEADSQWLAPTVQPATEAQAVGALVKGRVDAGKVVLARDVEPPVLVHKGDLVSVDCVAGTVVVGATARAKENGVDGQVIELQSLSSKKTYMARINGAGRAVLVMDADQSPDAARK